MGSGIEGSVRIRWKGQWSLRVPDAKLWGLSQRSVWLSVRRGRSGPSWTSKILKKIALIMVVVTSHCCFSTYEDANE